MARDCFDDHCARPDAVKRFVRIPEGSNLGVVRPIHAALPSQRSLLVVDRRNGLAKSAPAKFSLLSDHDRLRDCGFTSVRSQLETRNALGTWNRPRAQPDFVSVALRLDFAIGCVAERRRLERSLGYTFLLLLVLGRTAVWFAVACRAVDARPHHCAGPGRFNYAWRAKENAGRSDLPASAKSSGTAASKFFHSPVRGC